MVTKRVESFTLEFNLVWSGLINTALPDSIKEESIRLRRRRERLFPGYTVIDGTGSLDEKHAGDVLLHVAAADLKEIVIGATARQEMLATLCCPVCVVSCNHRSRLARVDMIISYQQHTWSCIGHCLGASSVQVCHPKGQQLELRHLDADLIIDESVFARLRSAQHCSM